MSKGHRSQLKAPNGQAGTISAPTTKNKVILDCKQSIKKFMSPII